MATRPRNTARTTPDTGATRAETVTARDDQPGKEAILGTDRSDRTSNISWGSIFAGVATFLALTVVLSLASAAMGLDGASGTATGIWTVVALAIALAVAGYVAGALAVRGGLLHGFLTWATSILAILVLAGWLSTTLLGAAGSLAGTLSEQVNVSTSDVQDAADEAQSEQPSDSEVEQAADDASTAAWWTFAGALIGAAVAAFAGAAGARSVIKRDTEVTTATRH